MSDDFVADDHGGMQASPVDAKTDVKAVGQPDAPTTDGPTIDPPTIDAPTIDGPTIDAPTIEKTVLKGMNCAELETWAQAELDERPFRGRQLYRWLYQKHAGDFDVMTDITKGLRERLAAIATPNALELKDVYRSGDGTAKLVFDVPRTGGRIESVWIPTEDRVTLCVSSQVGCALNCAFCLTAKMGLHAHLEAGEIVDQVVWAKRLLERDDKRLSNLVFMGMGEPLHNYDNVVKSVHLLTDDRGLNFSHRKITVSTVGLVPRIEQLGRDEVPVSLAVSLNATTDEVRDEIMPINRRYNIQTLINCLRNFPLPKRARITIEYVMLAGVNDSLDDARRLTRLLRGIPCKVNLIPWNPHEGGRFQRPARKQVLAFQEVLQDRFYNCLIRETRGDDQMAACGQLGGGPDGVVPGRRKAVRL